MLIVDEIYDYRLASLKPKYCDRDVLEISHAGVG